MGSGSKCRECGAPISDGDPGALCAKCLLGLGLEQAESSAKPITEDSDAGKADAGALAEKPGDKIGRYKLLQRLGEGGMGSVWMAEQTEPVRRTVALKVIKPGMDSAEVLARFEAERQALALMDHPNIAKVLEAGSTPEGRPYFVMDLVKGIPFIQFCDEQRLPVRERLELFMQVCQAVQHAHQKGIIHRDLKPGNVLVALYDGKPVPKVIDFGVAKAIGQRLTERTLYTKFGAVIGTLAYMSPEQSEMNQLDIDTRSDIYSLGVLLYELLTGTTPLTRESLHKAAFDEVLRRIREEEPPKPSLRLSTSQERLPAISAQRKLDPEKLTKLIRGELDWIVMKALEKDRQRRYETATGFARDLQRYLNDEAVLAGPPTVRYRLEKFVHKHRTALTVAAGFVVLLLAAVVVSMGLAVWANRERANALRAEHVAKDALSDMKIQRAEDFFATEDSSRALALLANVLSNDPSNRVAAERLLSALTFHNFSLPFAEPTRHEQQLFSAQFSPDGLRVVTASMDQTARVWDAQTGKPITEPLRHEGWVYSARFSPDGQRVVTASVDKTARVWDAQTGKPLTEPLRHEGDVHSAQFSPDGLRVVTACLDQTARVWDAQTGKPLTELWHLGWVYSAEFSPDGQRVVTASRDLTARVWDAQTGKPITDPLRHEGSVNSAQFSPDGQRVVTASMDQTARVWDAQTGKPITEPLRHEGWVYSARFSPDGQRVVTASYDKTARVWDAQTGKALTEPLRHESEVRDAHFSPDGLRVVTASTPYAGSFLGYARVWDARTGKPLTEPIRHENRVTSIQSSPDGLRLVTASGDKKARVWDTRAGNPFTGALRHESAVSSAQFSPDGLRVVTASDDKTARVWDAKTGKPLTEPMRHEDTVRSARFSPDGLHLVTLSDDAARVWDARTGKPLTEPLRHQWGISSAQFSADGLRVLTAARDKTARVWNALTGKPLTEPLRHEGEVYSAQFSPDGLWLVTASEDKMARVLNAQTGKPLTEPLRHEDKVNSAGFSSDGLRVVTASSDKTARVWDVKMGKPITEPLRHESRVRSAQFSPNGLWVVTSSDDNTARVWDVKTGKPLTEPLRHESEVWDAEFSTDGLRVVTVSADKTARVWDAKTGKPLTEPFRHADFVRSAHFSPDGLRVVTASSDKTARIWEMAFGSGPAPSWLPQLAAIVAGKRLTGNSVFEPVAMEDFLKLKEQLSMAPETNYYAHWAKWFCADRATRTISPLSSITVPEYVQQRIEENTLESVREAAFLSPTNGLAFARLATQVLAQSDKENPRRMAEASFFSQYALKWSHNDAEVQKIRTDLEEKIRNHPKQ